MSWVCTLPGAAVLAAVCYSLPYQLFHQVTPLLKQQPLATFLFVGAGFLILSALAMALLRSARVRLVSRRQPPLDQRRAVRPSNGNEWNNQSPYLRRVVDSAAHSHEPA